MSMLIKNLLKNTGSFVAGIGLWLLGGCPLNTGSAVGQEFDGYPFCHEATVNMFEQDCSPSYNPDGSMNCGEYELDYYPKSWCGGTTGDAAGDCTNTTASAPIMKLTIQCMPVTEGGNTTCTQDPNTLNLVQLYSDPNAPFCQVLENLA